MELKDFIKGVLSEITDGIIESQKSLKEKGMIVSPSISDGMKANVNGEIRTTTIVSFEVQLVETESDGTEFGGGFKINVLSAGASKKQGTSNSASSKVSFDIPVILPSEKVDVVTKTVTRKGIEYL